ncbi:hypothetical protein OIU74_018995 [Salix koriyanagi]|uniref:Uncharacterized protein n=1 Tax=Salix koriyanagi TaxID=2511006 RepID=A0A9Q1AIX1_9ROSI|nr:hypothetical protein OIU74_018995 [Salix koriyanagi]
MNSWVHITCRLILGKKNIICAFAISSIHHEF